MESNLYKFRQGEREIVLASGSPRRRELMAEMGLVFTVRPTDCDESVPAGTPPFLAVQAISRKKAEAGRVFLAAGEILVAADTTVDLDGMCLGKPRDREDGIRMLLSLSGRTHKVHTGVSVLYRGRLLTGADTTDVTFRPFGEAEAAAYWESGECADKAGAYGIQGLGGRLVAGIEGAYDNVVGLPTLLLDRLLCEVTE